ncbi:MAG: response regulator, partial [Chloroflexota bacterium]|nr:response regulator [Chloroflexota bacterium]
TYARPGDRTPAAIRPAEQRRDRQPAIGTVLVAEDDADQREIICDMLQLEGFEVVLAETGEEAIELATQIMPSAIALDVILPRRDGWEVLEALRQDPRTRDIPVLIISVVDQTDFGKKLGADEYLLKPLDPRSLRTAIRRLVLAHERDAATNKQNN